MENDIKLENHMGPKEAYKTFKKELLEKLKFPADQPNFIAWLKEKGVITDERTIKNLEMPYEAEGNRAIFILKEIHESLSISDTKFNNLLSLMEEYKQGLETLSRKIQSHLDPIGKDFDCEAMYQYLNHNSDSLSSLPYQQIDDHLIAHGVITSDKKTQIDDDMERYGKHDRKYQMRSVLSEIKTSLFFKQPKKFRSFLEILERSDQKLQKIAKALGGSKRVPPIGEATAFNIILIPVGQSDIQCDGKNGGSYLWKGHDFEIMLPPDCADGTVNITLKAYLPCSTQNHCLASAVFQIITNVKEFKKPIKLSLPHWVNISIKSETDKKKLQFLVFKSNPYGILQGSTQESFEVGESFASIEVSQVLLISICKKIVAARFAFSIAEDFQFHTDQILISTPTNYGALIISEERCTTEATGHDKAAKNKYLDLLVLPAEGHDEKWGIYCIALDNPTYLQAVMKYFIDEHQINSGIQILKRQVVFGPSSNNPVANLHTDTQADAKIIKIINNKQISKQKIDSLDLRALGSQILQIHPGYNILLEMHEINFPMWCSLNIIGKLSPASSKLKVDGLCAVTCGIKKESSEFSLASPKEHDYKFETYEHVAKPFIIKNPLQPEDLNVHKDRITETTITLSWEEPNPSNVPDPSDVPITGYEVQYAKSGEEFKKFEKSLTHEDLSCEVTGLVANTEYQFRVAAINAAGCGPFTDVVTQFTKPSQLKELSVLKDRITETTITLSWKEPNPSDVPITEYEVQYRKGGEELKIKKVKKSLTHEDMTCEVAGLVANTEYQFRVAAINAAGRGPFTDVVTQFTSFDYIGTAKHLKKQLRKLSMLSYDNMKTSLFANDVITTKEKKVIDSKIGCEKMEYLLEEIIIPSLEQGFGKKYKSFLKAMEDSEDTDLRDTAKMLAV